MELNHIKHSTLLALTSAIQLNLIKSECVLLKISDLFKDSYPTILPVPSQTEVFTFG